MTVDKIDTVLLSSQRRYHANQDDVPNKSAKDMKAFFDYIPREVIIPKVNKLIDAVTENDALIAKKESISDAAMKYSNALKGRKSGVTVSVDDASPIKHELSVKLLSKNRIDIKTAFLDSHNAQFLNNLSTIGNILYFEKTYSGSASVSAYVYAYLDNGTYTFSGIGATDGTGSMAYVIVDPDGNQHGNVTTIGQTYREFQHSITVNKSGVYTFKFYIGYSAAKGSYVSYKNLQLEKGTEKTDYTPYVNPEAITVSKFVHGNKVETAVSSSDGTVTGLTSNTSMELISNATNGSVLIELEYNKDINKAFEELWMKVSQ